MPKSSQMMPPATLNVIENIPDTSQSTQNIPLQTQIVPKSPSWYRRVPQASTFLFCFLQHTALPTAELDSARLLKIILSADNSLLAMFVVYMSSDTLCKYIAIPKAQDLKTSALHHTWTEHYNLYACTYSQKHLSAKKRHG